MPQLTLDDISVSTPTFMSYTNINELDLDLMFDEININKFLVHMLYREREKGFKKKKKSKNNTKHFLNCIYKEKKSKNNTKHFLNCIFFMFNKNEKKVNLKLFRNGVIQLTGCKSFSHCKKGLSLFWDIIRNINCCSKFEYLEAYLVSVMRNVNINLGFLVDREKLAHTLLKKPVIAK